MTEVQIKMADLYDRLAGIGFSKKFVLRRKILPGWWSEEADQDPDVVFAGATYLATRLNVNVRWLLGASEVLTFMPTGSPKFKLKNGTDLQRLKIPRALSSRVAELVAYGCKQPYLGVQDWSIERIREQILRSQDTVDLAGFLDFCWSIGIPVVHCSAFPDGVQKFQGMVAYYGDRPVILLSYNHKSLARLLFIAAHELGHLLKGHVTPDEPLIDERVELTADDEDEAEANQVAAELLIGRWGMSYYLLDKFVTGEQLATQSRQWAQRDNVNSGVVALNITWSRTEGANTKKDKDIIWGVGSKALKILEPNADAPRMINRVLSRYIDWEKLGDETTEYLTTMLNLDDVV
jgi:IrrE N-terminal-like domain